MPPPEFLRIIRTPEATSFLCTTEVFANALASGYIITVEGDSAWGYRAMDAYPMGELFRFTHGERFSIELVPREGTLVASDTLMAGAVRWAEAMVAENPFAIEDDQAIAVIAATSLESYPEEDPAEVGLGTRSHPYEISLDDACYAFAEGFLDIVEGGLFFSTGVVPGVAEDGDDIPDERFVAIMSAPPGGSVRMLQAEMMRSASGDAHLGEREAEIIHWVINNPEAIKDLRAFIENYRFKPIEPEPERRSRYEVLSEDEPLI